MIRKTAGRRSTLTADGRVVTFDVSGATEGATVFLLHGTPGSGSGPKPRSIKLDRLGIRLISYDRPGYGGSDRHAGRIVGDAAGDVAAIADELGIDRFAVVGRSGGGPHALACAAVLGDRVSRAAVLVSIAPADAADLNWFNGMNDHNSREYAIADRDAHAYRMNPDNDDAPLPANADALLESVRAQLSPSDRRVVEDVAMRRLLLETYSEGLSQGQIGWIDDVLAFRKPWGFELSDITSPVRLWHGADDHFSPINHSRWLAAHIPGAELMIQPNCGHFAAVEILPTLLPWLARSGESPFIPSAIDARPANIFQDKPRTATTV